MSCRLAAPPELQSSLAALAAAAADTASEKWLSRLAGARWLSHVKEALNTACLVAQLLEREGSPVLVVEAEARDLSILVTSLALIILDPDTRTLHGFEALVEREWVQAGHPFWSRHGPTQGEAGGQVAPVFLLFLDCVFQIYSQFPCSFEFTEKLLVVLADHSVASNFGTFLCDCEKERQEQRVREETVSLWSYLNQVEILCQHLNPLYLPHPAVIWPSVAPMSLELWTMYFLRWVQAPALAAVAQERRRIGEIVERNKAAQVTATRLRRELQELMEEAVQLGILEKEEDVEDLEYVVKEEETEAEVTTNEIVNVVKSHPLEV